MPHHETESKRAVATSSATTASAAEKHRRYLFPCVTTYYENPLTLVRGEGMHVWDDAGRKYLDCFGGVLTVSVGHCHPDVTDAIVRQVKTLVHTSTLYATPPLSDLAATRGWEPTRGVAWNQSNRPPRLHFRARRTQE